MGQQLSVCHVSTLAANVRFESQAGVCDVASNLLEPGSGRMAQKAKRQALGGGPTVRKPADIDSTDPDGS